MDLGFLHFASDINYGRWLLWIPLLPLLGAIILGTVGHRASRQLVHALAVGTVGTSFFLAAICVGRLVTMEHPPGVEPPSSFGVVVYEWFKLSLGDASIPVRVAFTMDHLSGVMTLVVTGIGALIHLYATGYMAEEKSYARFFCYLNLFTASMLILVLASSMPVMFVGWEGVGLCSYLLIGFWWEKPSYAAAGKKAFIFNRIGDFGVILGMFLLAGAASSFDFADINANASHMLSDVSLDHSHTLPVSVATVACLFLFLGCTGKSAQIPLFVWLPDAMAGPTPVSALIHAATMVTAGVYLCCRLSPIFVLSPIAMATIAIIGAATALLAASIALVQNEMKKILAYSTVSQLGFMFAGVGVGAFGGGFFHVFTHAFFKACLFLGAGSVMHAVGAHGDADIRKLGGLRKLLPTTHWTFLAACLAIAGAPLTAGFFSKDDLFLGALMAGRTPWAEFPSWVGWTVFVSLAVAATMTAFYMFRLYFKTFGGEYKRSLPHVHAEGEAHSDDEPHDHPYDEHPHESPWEMTTPLVILGVGALVVGFLGMPAWLGVPNVWEHWLEPNLAALPRIGELAEGAEKSAGVIAMAVGTLVCFGGGAGLAFAFYNKEGNETPATIEHALGPLPRWALHKWYVDELYGAIVVWPSRLLARLVSGFDKAAVDGLLTGLTSLVVRFGGWAFTRPQNGLVYTYGAVMIGGIGVLLAWVVVPHPGLQHAVRNNEVKFVAAAGLGYEYRWDSDGDGHPDTDWDASATELDHTYEASEYRGGAALVETFHIGIEKEEIRLRDGQVYALSNGQLGDDWRVEGGSGVRPGILWKDGKLVVRPNGAAAIYHGARTTDEVQLEPGDMLQLGQCAVRAAAVVRATVEVRNAFSYVSEETAEVVITPPVAGQPEQAQLEGGR